MDIPPAKRTKLNTVADALKKHITSPNGVIPCGETLAATLPGSLGVVRRDPYQTELVNVVGQAVNNIEAELERTVTKEHAKIGNESSEWDRLSNRKISLEMEVKTLTTEWESAKENLRLREAEVKRIMKETNDFERGKEQRERQLKQATVELEAFRNGPKAAYQELRDLGELVSPPVLTETSSSRFLVIGGYRYDRQLLEDAEQTMHVGPINLKTIEDLWTSACADGPGLTATEWRTFQRICDKFTLAPDAKVRLQELLRHSHQSTESHLSEPRVEKSSSRVEKSSSNFLVIDGYRYDKALLEDAEQSAHLGPIDLQTMGNLWRSACLDGPGLTATERRTFQRIHDKYTLSFDAKVFLADKLRGD